MGILMLLIDCFLKTMLSYLLFFFFFFSEFDIAAFVVFVGEVYKGAQHMKQWVFVTDSSISELQSEEFSDCLLAICFCSPNADDDSSVPFNRNLAGSTVSIRTRHKSLLPKQTRFSLN